MKRTIQSALFALLAIVLFAPVVSCSDNTDTETDTGEFTDNWQQRNAQYFDSILNVACAEVNAARAAYGDDEWENHCQWRVYRSYSKNAGGNSHDSICAQVIETGTDEESPLYTDSIKVNYMGRLIPTASYPEGRVFDHSGLYEKESAVFSQKFSTPTALSVSNLVEGYTTVVMQMHVGDRWKVYIPQELGYMSASQGVLPAYSTLIFDMQLKDIAHKGESFK